MKQAGFIVSLFCFLLTTACSDNDPVVAQVDDSTLTSNEANILMEHLGYDTKDPKDWKIFLDLWTEQEALRLELKNIDPKLAKLSELRAQSFAGELSKYYLQELKINALLDTVISQKELENYYNEHKVEFELQDYLVQALYLKVPKGIKVEKDIKNHYVLKNDKDLGKINSYAKLYAEDFYFDDQQWIYFNDLTKDIPLRGFNRDNIVLNRTKTYFSDDEFTYFVNIIDYKLKNTEPPFEFLVPQIREIILSKRLNQLREKIDQQLIQKTKSKHDIQINL